MYREKIYELKYKIKLAAGVSSPSISTFYPSGKIRTDSFFLYLKGKEWWCYE